MEDSVWLEINWNILGTKELGKEFPVNIEIARIKNKEGEGRKVLSSFPTNGF